MNNDLINNWKRKTYATMIGRNKYKGYRITRTKMAYCLYKIEGNKFICVIDAWIDANAAKIGCKMIDKMERG